MRFVHIRTIFWKELRESLRDRRTLFMMVGVPILLYPLLMIGMSRLQESQKAAQSARASRVAIWGSLPDDLSGRLTADDKIVAIPWTGAPAELREQIESGQVEAPPPRLSGSNPDGTDGSAPLIPEAPWAKAAQQTVLNREVDAVLIAWPGFAADVAGGGLGYATILFDSVRPDSIKAQQRLRGSLEEYRRDLLAARERTSGLTQGFTTGVVLEMQNIAPQKRRTGMLLGSLLPYMLIMFSVMSGFYAAIDATAGEKERGTMQTLLCAPLDPMEIISGKFLAVWTISVMATVVNIFSLSMTFTHMRLIPGLSSGMPPSAYLVAFLMLLPISMMMTALFLAVGAFAKDFKDGQNYLTPLLMGLLVPLAATMLPGIELNGYLAFVPVVNIALLIKGVFVSEWQADILFLVILSSFCYASLALLFAARVFERNNVLLGGKEGFGSLLDFSRAPGSRPTPAVSLFAFALVLVLTFYGSLSLLKYGITMAVPLIQFGFFLLPALLIVLLKGYNWRETLSLRRLPWKGVLAAVLIGLSGWTVAGGLLVRLLPPPESLVKGLEKILLLDDKTASLWQVWLLMAVIPAVCEETLFRGVILSGFRRLGMWPAILLTGLLFGLAHSSIYRLLPTFFLGAVFTYAVWKTGSIYAGMIAHVLNNGLMALLTRSKETAAAIGLSGARVMPWELVLVGSVLLAVGLLLLHGMREEPGAQPSAAPVTA